MILTNIVGALATLQTIHKIGNYYAPLTLKNQSYITISNNELREGCNGVYNSIRGAILQ